MKAKKLMTYWTTTIITFGFAQGVLIKSELYRLIFFGILIISTVILMAVLYKKQDPSA